MKVKVECGKVVRRGVISRECVSYVTEVLVVLGRKPCTC